MTHLVIRTPDAPEVPRRGATSVVVTSDFYLFTLRGESLGQFRGTMADGRAVRCMARVPDAARPDLLSALQEKRSATVHLSTEAGAEANTWRWMVMVVG